MYLRIALARFGIGAIMVALMCCTRGPASLRAPIAEPPAASAAPALDAAQRQPVEAASTLDQAASGDAAASPPPVVEAKPPPPLKALGATTRSPVPKPKDAPSAPRITKTARSTMVIAAAVGVIGLSVGIAGVEVAREHPGPAAYGAAAGGLTLGAAGLVTAGLLLATPAGKPAPLRTGVDVFVHPGSVGVRGAF